MNFQMNIQVLRVKLLSMSRLSQRALDDSVKGYELGISDFCDHARSVERQFDEHYRQIEHLSCHLMTAGVTSPADFRFIVAALRLNSILYAMYSAASLIAEETARLLENSPLEKQVALNSFGTFVNCSVRLCIVALFNQNPGYAEEVLQNRQAALEHERTLDHLHSCEPLQMGAEETYTLTIARNLGVIAKQAHEMADVILFWLKGEESFMAIDSDGDCALDFVFAESRIGAECRYQPAPSNQSPIFNC